MTAARQDASVVPVASWRARSRTALPCMALPVQEGENEMLTDLGGKCSDLPATVIPLGLIRRIIRPAAISLDGNARFPAGVVTLCQHDLEADQVGDGLLGMLDHLLQLFVHPQFVKPSRCFRRDP